MYNLTLAMGRVLPFYFLLSSPTPAGRLTVEGSSRTLSVQIRPWLPLPGARSAFSRKARGRDGRVACLRLSRESTANDERWIGSPVIREHA